MGHDSSFECPLQLVWPSKLAKSSSKPAKPNWSSLNLVAWDRIDYYERMECSLSILDLCILVCAVNAQYLENLWLLYTIRPQTEFYANRWYVLPGVYWTPWHQYQRPLNKFWKNGQGLFVFRPMAERNQTSYEACSWPKMSYTGGPEVRKLTIFEITEVT